MSKVGVYPCIESSENQLFSLTNGNQIRRNDYCCYSDSKAGSPLKMTACASKDNPMSNQIWSHTKVYFRLLPD